MLVVHSFSFRRSSNLKLGLTKLSWGQVQDWQKYFSRRVALQFQTGDMMNFILNDESP